MEQLGYQAESSTFRNAYLNAAQELRQGPPPIAGKPVRARGILRAMTVEQIFDAMSIRLQSEALGGIKTELNVTVNDLRTHWVIGISNRTLYYQAAPASTSAQANISLSRETLIDVMSGERLIGEAVNDGLVKVDGPIEPVEQTFGHLDTFMSGFNVIEP
jgi:alkyl sulfatase BDS1-like metallo-beta-lactamase superfamily hydrolase